MEERGERGGKFVSISNLSFGFVSRRYMGLF